MIMILEIWKKIIWNFRLGSKNIEGITILQTVVEKHATWGFSWLGLFCVIAAIGIFILCLIVDEGSLV